MKLKYDGCSMRGAIRRRNEDAILIKCNDSTGLFLVADGIGGSAYGQEASGLIRDRYNEGLGKQIFLRLCKRSKNFCTRLMEKFIKSTDYIVQEQLLSFCIFRRTTAFYCIPGTAGFIVPAA